jgi:steroid 5-alpha reductase family enzyme
MSSLISLLIVWASIALVMVLFYLIQLKTQNATLVDVVWAAGLGLTACFYAAMGAGDASRRIMLAILAGIWSFRLVFYLILRSLGKPEDGRYAMLRSKWGDAGAKNFFLFYQAQASWVVLFSIPFLVVSHNGLELWAWHDLAALAIWFITIAGESLADQQLNRFRAETKNQGKTCCKGLWKYSRHPNYFFEWLHWFTYVFLAIGSRWWWISLSGPIVMLFFLYKLTGIPYTEKRALQSRGEDYHRYQQTTSAFIPWFPKKGSHEADN